MTTATIHAKQTTLASSLTLDSWNNILFLVQEPDRHGNTVWNVRLSLGDLPPWRYGPRDQESRPRRVLNPHCVRRSRSGGVVL